MPTLQRPIANKKTTNWLLISLAVLLFGIIGFFGHKYYELKKQIDKAEPTASKTRTSSTSTSASETGISTEPQSSPEKTDVLEQVKTLSTVNWKLVSNNGVSFKIPPAASCNSEQCSNISYVWDYEGHTTTSHIYIQIADYAGGSRREQFLASHTETASCRPLYKEAVFGSVRALQIAIDGGFCQGSSGGIVAVISNKLAIFDGGLTYNPDTKVIRRWDIRDTVISTLKSL